MLIEMFNVILPEPKVSQVILHRKGGDEKEASNFYRKQVKKSYFK